MHSLMKQVGVHFISLLRLDILRTSTILSLLGVVDVGRRGGMSLTKQVKALVKFLSREVQIKGKQGTKFHS